MESGVTVNPDIVDQNNSSARLYFLDNLRVFIILLVIILHLAISYVIPTFPSWIHNIQSNYLFWLICIPLQSSVLMPAMFFVAGCFAIPSLLKKGSSQFMKDKLFRLGIPYAVGVVILAPILEYMAVISSGKHETIIDRFLLFFNPQYFSQYHFWFLGVLLFFFFIIFCLFSFFGNKFFTIESNASKLSPGLILIFFILTVCARFAVDVLANPTDFASQWFKIYILQFEKTGIPLHIAYFILGIYACRKRWFENNYKPRIYPWALLYAFSSIMNIYLQLFVFQKNPAGIIGKLILAFILCIEALSFLFMLIAIFREFFNGNGILLRKISKSSFVVYLIHLNILFIILFMTKNIPLPIYLKFFIQLGTTIVISWAIGYTLKKIPVINKFL